MSRLANAQRRIIFVLLFALAGLPVTLLQADESRLLKSSFRNPPDPARPSVYYLWLNGYVERDVVRSELQQFFDTGLRGICLFDMGARGDARGRPPAGPAFLSDHSIADIGSTVKLAGEIGLEVGLSVASSWDMGGTWVDPKMASMGIYCSGISVQGPRKISEQLPMPDLPKGAPRDARGKPAFLQEVAVLALPQTGRFHGYEFVFRLDPPGLHQLDHAVLYNASSDSAKQTGPNMRPVRQFAIDVSETSPSDDAFHELYRGSLNATARAQTFDLPPASARFARLRLIGDHGSDSDQLQFGEFELYDDRGVNVVASHHADRSRDGGELIGYPASAGYDRLWTAANLHDGATSGSAGCWKSPAWQPVTVTDVNALRDLSTRVDEHGKLQWQVPPGRWLILRFICANTGERLKVPSPLSDGLATDHLSRTATAGYLNHVIDRLKSGISDLPNSALNRLYLASYEVRGPIWTPGMLDRFREYRGYDMKRYLPALVGNQIVSKEVTDRFLYDFRKTLGDLLVDAYYREAVNVAHRAGLEVESEAGGPGPPIHQVPVDALKALGSVDCVRGEFWPKRPDAQHLWVVKETACAAHVYGKRRVRMEAFTSMHHWQDGPFDLKPSADRAFCEGANQFVWHTAAHLPPSAGRPGWVYLAGTHLNTNLVWWPMAKPFVDYLSRCSYMLQRGVFVGDVCYYYGDQGYNFVPPKHVDPSLGPGFDYDVINRDALLNRLAVRNGRFVLPDGLSYRVLVLPDRKDMDLDVLIRLEHLVRAGGVIVGSRPEIANGLTDYPSRDRRVRDLANTVWGSRPDRPSGEHRLGSGRVIWGRSVRSVLKQMGVGPDFQLQDPTQEADVDFIHRRSDNADIYFVSNRLDTGMTTDVTFRSARGTPQLWDAVTGESHELPVFLRTPETTRLTLHLAPHGSIFVVFRDGPDRRGELRVTNPGGDQASRHTQLEPSDDHRLKLTTRRGGRYSVATGMGEEQSIDVAELPEPIKVSGPWNVEFSGLQSPEPVILDRLVSWTDSEQNKLRHFSGVAHYATDFELPVSWLAGDRGAVLDLGRLWAVGKVSVNGNQPKILWAPPFQLDVTRDLQPGKNHIRIDVANTWSNRLIGDADLPVESRSTRTNVSSSGGKPWKQVPLRSSGLFGPVRLYATRSVYFPDPDPDR